MFFTVITPQFTLFPFSSSFNLSEKRNVSISHSILVFPSGENNVIFRPFSMGRDGSHTRNSYTLGSEVSLAASPVPRHASFRGNVLLLNRPLDRSVNNEEVMNKKIDIQILVCKN
jgi:hypothetical protein